MTRNKKLLIILFGFIILWSLFFVTDSIRKDRNQKPIFCIETGAYDDGGSIRYTGLFYTVYYVVDIDTSNEPPIIYYGYYMTTWFNSLAKLKDKILE